MGTTETEWRLTQGHLALFIRLIRIVTTVIVPIAHELAWNAHTVGAFEFVLGTLPSVGVIFTVHFIRCIRAIPSPVTPFVLGNARAIIALLHPIRTFAQQALRLVQPITALNCAVADLGVRNATPIIATEFGFGAGPGSA
jgi:hypothetical protein